MKVPFYLDIIYHLSNEPVPSSKVMGETVCGICSLEQWGLCTLLKGIVAVKEERQGLRLTKQFLKIKYIYIFHFIFFDLRGVHFLFEANSGFYKYKVQCLRWGLYMNQQYDINPIHFAPLWFSHRNLKLLLHSHLYHTKNCNIIKPQNAMPNVIPMLA